MPITTRWYDDNQRVILQVYQGAWTWEELGREAAAMREMAAAVSHNVILFSDMSESNFMPSGNVLSQGRSIVQKIPHNVSLTVIVIQSRLIEVFTSMAMEMVAGMRHRFKFVKTVEEGQQAVKDALAASQQ